MGKIVFKFSKRTRNSSIFLKKIYKMHGHLHMQNLGLKIFIKMNNKFKQAWEELLILEKSENQELADYEDQLLDILNSLFNHWPEGFDDLSLADELNTTVAKVTAFF